MSKSLFIEQVADEVVLREAWHRVQRGGRTAGVDGTTVDAFRPHADGRLRWLRNALATGAYQPSAVKRVQIPKPAGGLRSLGIPTILDRIAQTAAALILHERVTTSFSDRSFAYRPFLGARRAAFFLKTLLPTSGWVVTADIAKYFDNVDHGILGGQLRAAGVDETGVQFVLRCLRAPVQDGARRYQPVKGLAQGSPISPVLANLYLTGFDTALQAEGFAHVRYADDFVILAPDKAEAQRALRYLTAYLLSRLRLEIKPAKTQITTLAEGFTFVGFHFTKDQWTVPAASIERFKASVTEIVNERRLALPDACQAHNDLVAGWRNYYGGTSLEMDQQLAELDSWRAAAADARIELEALPNGPMRSVRTSLLLLEARAAAHYWGAFATLVPRGLAFRKRMHREAADIVNKSLNYGYAFVLHRVWAAVHHAGLEPALGIIHTGRRRTPALVFDLMEPFRQPVVDRTVLALVGRGARLTLNQDGELSMRTRATLQAAFARRLSATRPAGHTLDAAIRRQALAFRHAIERGRSMSVHRMSW